MSGYTIDFDDIQAYLITLGFTCEIKDSKLIASLPDTGLKITITLRRMTIVDEYKLLSNTLSTFQQRQSTSDTRQILLGTSPFIDNITLANGDLTDYETSLAMIRNNRDKIIQVIEFFISLKIIPLFYLIGLIRNQSQDILMYVIASATEVKIQITG